MIFLALFYSVAASSEQLKLLRTAGFFLSFSLLCMCIFVLVNATIVLTSGRGPLSEITGCFKVGRLCALGNANEMGFAACALIMVSVFGFINSKIRLKAYYIFTGILGWFCLGLTGFRTGALGVSLTIGIMMIIYGIRFFCLRKKNHLILRIVGVVLVTGGLMFLMIRSFLLPSVIYKGIVSIFSGDAAMFISNRKILDDDGTFSGRTYIWLTTIKSLFKNPRRFFLGISISSMEQIAGVYAGHHESIISHAHNTFLELFRIHGFLGLAIWMFLLIRFGINGIKKLFDPETEAGVCYLICIAAGILFIGIAEPVPFLFTASWPLTMLFFLVCGYFSETERSN
jgi:O-antigen ligase